MLNGLNSKTLNRWLDGRDHRVVREYNTGIPGVTLQQYVAEDTIFL